MRKGRGGCRSGREECQFGECVTSERGIGMFCVSKVEKMRDKKLGGVLTTAMLWISSCSEFVRGMSESVGS